jgi:hypothetical protein
LGVERSQATFNVFQRWPEVIAAHVAKFR